MVRIQLELLRRSLPQNSPRVETQQGYGVSGLPLDIPSQMAGTRSPVSRGSSLEDIRASRLDHFALVAQLVERLHDSQEVSGVRVSPSALLLKLQSLCVPCGLVALGPSF